MRSFRFLLAFLFAACANFELAPASLSCAANGDCPASFECKEQLCSYCPACVGADTSGSVPPPTCAPSSGTANHYADVQANAHCAAWIAALPCFCHGGDACLKNASQTLGGLSCIPVGADPASFAPSWTAVCDSQRASILASAPACAP